MTAADLLAQLRPHGVQAAGESLAFDAPASDFQADALIVLGTGVRAILTGRRWFGIDAKGRGVGPLDYGALKPDLPLPPTTRMLTVEGDKAWVRIGPDAATEFPHLFATPKAAKGKAFTVEMAEVAGGLW